MNRRAAILLIAVVVAGCGVSKKSEPQKSAGNAVSLSRQERVAVFEDVWKTINEQYYDSTFHGTSWQRVHGVYRPQAEATRSDVELYKMFELMLAELRDAHTSFSAPRSHEDSTFRPSGDAGIKLGYAEGKTVVTRVEPGSDPALAGVRPGMVLRSVNGRAVDDLYREIRSKIAGSSTDRSMAGMMNGALLYGGFLGAGRTFGIETFDGHVLNVQITHFKPLNDDVVTLMSRRLPSGNGYIAFDGWRPPVDRQFATALSGMMDAPGLVIDLRGNGGGQTTMILNIASLLFSGKVDFGTFTRRSGLAETIITHRSPRPYNGRVIVIVDEASASASEVFAVSMQESGRAKIAGRPSCGCVLNQWTKLEKGGGSLRWSGRVYTSPNGRVVEGKGVTPDLRVPQWISDLRSGVDAALEAADNALKEGK